MATVLNTRDVMLQAALSRLANVQMASNLIIDQTQVSGLGLVILGTKSAYFGATTQVFQIDTGGAASPSSTTVTANLRNISATPVITVTNGTITPVPVLDVNNVVTINASDMTTDSVTLHLSVTENGVTFTDDLTIVKVRQGGSAVVGFLTNESHAVEADYLGNVTSYNGATGLFKMYSGSSDVSLACSYSLAANGNPSGLAVTISPTGIYTASGGLGNSTASATIILQAVYGTTTITKSFTLTKTKTNAPAIHLSATSPVFQVAKDGTVTPASITLTQTQFGISGTPVFTVSPNTATIVTTAGGSQATLSYANMAGNKSVVVTVTNAGMTDSVTITTINDGTDSISSVLSNDSTTVASDSAGNNVNYAGANTTLSIYKGVTDVTAAWASTAVATNCTVTPTSRAAGVTPTYTVSAITADVAYVDITATCAGFPNQTKRFTVTRARAGTLGTNGQRGSRTFYVTLGGTTAVWSDATATSAATADGGPVLNDTVVEYNNSQNFSQTKFWNGTVWVIVNAIIDGNLLVSGTVGANTLSANMLQSDNVVTRNLTVRDNAGGIILSSSQALGGTYIQNAAITTAKIQDAAITTAKILDANITSAKIVDASVTNAKIGNFIQSTNFDGVIDGSGNITNYGTAGWAIGKGGNAAFNNAVFRGTIYANAGTFAGALSAATGSFSGSLSGATGTFSGSLTANGIVNTAHITPAAITETAAWGSISSGVSFYVPDTTNYTLIVGLIGGGGLTPVGEAGGGQPITSYLYLDGGVQGINYTGNAGIYYAGIVFLGAGTHSLSGATCGNFAVLNIKR
jgi:hypothetical protein